MLKLKAIRDYIESLIFVIFVAPKYIKIMSQIKDEAEKINSKLENLNKKMKDKNAKVR